MQRLLQREEARHLTTVAEIDQSRTFLDWAAHYDLHDRSGRSRQAYEQWIQQLRCPVLRLEGDLSIAEQVPLIMARIGSLQLIAT